MNPKTLATVSTIVALIAIACMVYLTLESLKTEKPQVVAVKTEPKAEPVVEAKPAVVETTPPPVATTTPPTTATAPAATTAAPTAEITMQPGPETTTPPPASAYQQITQSPDWYDMEAGLKQAFKKNSMGAVVKWRNPDNGHAGTIKMTGGDDGHGCRQYRLGEIPVNEDSINYIEYCRDGRVKESEVNF